MECLKNGIVIVELSQGCFECDKESIVDARMTYVVPYGGDQQNKSVEGFQKFRDWRNRSLSLRRQRLGGVRWQRSDLHEKVEDGLKNIYDMTEVVVKDEAIVS